ncbi:unnamed protein product [Calypogeia fissa]
MVGTCIHKKSNLGSQIRMILAWNKKQWGKGEVNPPPSSIPPHIPPPTLRPRTAPMTTKEQALIDLVALAIISTRSRTVAGATNGTMGGEMAITPEEPANTVMVEVVPRKPRRTVAQQIATAEGYDQLVKEKTSWASSQKQLEDELRDEKFALEKVIGEQDDARDTIAKDADVIRQQLQLLTNVN